MTTYYDEQGNAVEAFSKEELEAQLAQVKKENVPQDASEQDAPDLSPVLDRLQKTESALYEMRVEKLADSHAGNDADKRQAFVTKFGRLTGYEETAEGMAERAKDAAKLAFDTAGEGASTEGLADAGGRGEEGGGKVVAPSSSAEAELRDALGITDKDVEKYSKTQ